MIDKLHMVLRVIWWSHLHLMGLGIIAYLVWGWFKVARHHDWTLLQTIVELHAL